MAKIQSSPLDTSSQGAGRNGARLPLNLSPAFIAKLEQSLNAPAVADLRFERLYTQVLLMCSEGDFDRAEEIIRKFGQEPGSIALTDSDFTKLCNALFALQRFDLLATLLGDRFGSKQKVRLAIGADGPGPGRQKWKINSDGVEFIFNADLLAPPDDFHGLLHFIWEAPLLFNYINNNKREYGEIFINQWDIGRSPGICYCDNRPDYFLVPDYIFVSTRGYQFAKDAFYSRNRSWESRKQVAFWRGATTGLQKTPGDWRSLERARLCELAQRSPFSEFFDVGFSHIAQISSENTIDEIKKSNLLRGNVPWSDWGEYKFLIDIDGNSSPWSNLIQRLLSGSAVLKVESARGLKQWYYERLVPWVHYVPVAPDMSDLVDKVMWLNSHDEIARKIGQAGQEFAYSLQYEEELSNSVAVISSAFRSANGSSADFYPPQRGLAEKQALDAPLVFSPKESHVRELIDILALVDFDEATYIVENPDLKGFSGKADLIAQHLLSHGLKEGRKVPVYDIDRMRSWQLDFCKRNNITSWREGATVSSQKHVLRYLSEEGPHRLEIGAGRVRRPGWLSTDLEARKNSDGTYAIGLDARKPFPIPSDSFDFIYCEHMIEHITFAEGVKMLTECFRVLKPGGVIRIATPAVGMLLRVMSPDRTKLEEDYFRASIKASVPDAPKPTIAFFLNNFVRNWGHTFIYDRETLIYAFEAAGFSSVNECDFGESQYSELSKLEHEDRMPPGFLNLETMSFEGVKPSPQ